MQEGKVTLITDSVREHIRNSVRSVLSGSASCAQHQRAAVGSV